MRKENGYFAIELDEKPSTVDEAFYLKDLAQRKLFLEAEIDAFSVADVIHHIYQFNAEDREIPKEERRPVILYIFSPGGDVDAGFALIDAIEASETPVHTVNIGMQYSMAFLIGLAGHKRYATKNAKFLMHDGSSFAMGTTSKLQDQMAFQSRVEERVKAYVLSHSRLTEEEYRDKYRVEWYMFADEAKRYGFTDCIVGEDCPVDEVV